ncbi:MAG: DUF4116 domain-containing protein, partial [Candidatus Thorarchaeota archaeon]
QSMHICKYMTSFLKPKFINMSDLERVKKNPAHLAYVENQTEEMCFEAVSRNGLSLYYTQFKTDEIIRTAIKQNPHALNFIEQTDEWCRLAVTEDGTSIQFVEKKTPELCLLAVRQNGGALSFIPKDMWTTELCIEAIHQDPTVLQLIDDQTEEMCLTAVTLNPETIVYVKNQTGAIIKEAVKNAKPGTASTLCTSFIDFKKFRIGSIYNTETGESYTMNNVYEHDSVVQEDTVEVDTTITYSSDKRKLIYFNDIRKDKIMYINNAVSIQDEIEKYIRQRYGNKCLVKALAYFSTGETIDNIKNDMTFDEGVFFIKNSDNSYDMYKKSTKYDKSWWYGKTQSSTIEKIREYGIIEEE